LGLISFLPFFTLGMSFFKNELRRFNRRRKAGPVSRHFLGQLFGVAVASGA